MAAGDGLALPEPLQDGDSRSWFKRYEVCAVANGWDAAKKLQRLPTLLRGRAWAIYDSLPEEVLDTYDHLKAALLGCLSPDTEEDRLAAREQLTRRKFRVEAESIDELARDLERLLDRASPNLPAEVRDTELRYHLISALPDKVALQIKLLPVTNFVNTMSKARELCLIYGRAAMTESVNHLQSTEDAQIKRMEEALHGLTEQLTALTARRQEPPKCFTCGKPGHMARNCRTRRMQPATLTCFKCRNKGHIARDCKNQGNGTGGTQFQRAGSAPQQW